MLFETKCPQSLSAPKQNNDLFGVKQIIKEKKRIVFCGSFWKAHNCRLLDNGEQIYFNGE